MTPAPKPPRVASTRGSSSSRSSSSSSHLPHDVAVTSWATVQQETRRRLTDRGSHLWALVWAWLLLGVAPLGHCVRVNCLPAATVWNEHSESDLQQMQRASQINSLELQIGTVPTVVARGCPPRHLESAASAFSPCLVHLRLRSGSSSGCGGCAREL